MLEDERMNLTIETRSKIKKPNSVFIMRENEEVQTPVMENDACQKLCDHGES
jgi:hypothetical protein